ncbi:MAG: TadE/TadG family type IV pilus assembly protein [Anaerovibrio sp.]
MLREQRAQGIVEFAVVLPLFLLLSMGVIYFGMAFSDYLTMSNTVRSIAHEASLKSTDDDYKAVIRNETRGVTLVSDIYVWQPDSVNGTNNDFLSVTYDGTTHNVVVRARAQLSTESAIANAVNNILGDSIGNAMRITYTMYTDRK